MPERCRTRSCSNGCVAGGQCGYGVSDAAGCCDEERRFAMFGINIDMHEIEQPQNEEARALRKRQEREAAEQEAKALENYHGSRWWESG
jgi:hypothetical protein